MKHYDRLDRIVDTERGWELLRNKIVKKFAINLDDEDTLTKIAHGLYESEKRLAVEQGRGADIERIEHEIQTRGDILDRYKGLAKEKQEIQERTLKAWLDYLHENDAEYPTWFRYFVVRNLHNMGTLDKEKGKYSKRTDYTIAPFPELNSEALGFVYRMLTTGIGSKEFADEADQEKREQLGEFIEKKDFIKLYTFAQIETVGSLNRESLHGEWQKYNQGSNHHILEDALRGKGTGWCTAEGSAYAHLQGGDFYVYYTKGKSGTYSEPRIAIRMDGERVAEVRGANHRQELEPVLVDIAQKQYRTLPGGEKFDKKSQDMKKMTEIAKKQERKETFTKGDLMFLYELNAPIEGFGYDKDPRVVELRSTRNPEADMLTIFECITEQVAHNAKEINENTKAYLGPWSIEIYHVVKNYSNIQYLYESFPDKKIFMMTLENDPAINSSEKVEHIFKEKNIWISDYAHDLLSKITFSKEQQHYELVQFTVEQLGFPQGATTEQIYQKAQKLGLELCPAEVGPHLRLSYPGTDWKFIAMKQITDRGGFPVVFFLLADGAGLGLSTDWAWPEYRWLSFSRLVFRSRASG